MKKLLTLLTVAILMVGVSYAQSNDTERDALIKKIEKSDKDIDNPKKSVKYQTWAKRGDLFLKSYSLNFKYLYQGMEYGTIPLLGISDQHPTPYYGKPLQEEQDGDFTVWVYSRLKIYINNQTKLVDHWEDLDPIDEDALTKSYDAYMKAIELDVDKKFINKKSTMEELQTLRDNLMNLSFEYYNDDDSEKALTYLEKSISLFDYPRTDADTFATVGAYYYYAGIFAYNAKQMDKSKDYFNKAITSGYEEIGACHQYVAQIMFEQGDTTSAVQYLEKGATDYPNEIKIIYSLIDYYTPIGEYDKALKYLDIAIDKAPDNPILYIVKASAIEKVYKSIEEKYFVMLTEADGYDKKAFQNRNNPQVKNMYTAKKDSVLNLAPTKKQEMLKYAQDAVSAYENGIKLDTSGTPDFNYSLALFYYERGSSFKTNASGLRKLSTIIDELNTEGDELLKKAKEYAEVALTFDEEDIYTLNLLSKIYYKLQDLDKYEEIKKKIDAFQGSR